MRFRKKSIQSGRQAVNDFMQRKPIRLGYHSLKPEIKKSTICHTFIVDDKAFSKVETIHVAGSFNNWLYAKSGTIDPQGELQKQWLMKQKADGSWELMQSLAPGHYEFKFIIDGEQWYPQEANSQLIIEPTSKTVSSTTISTLAIQPAWEKKPAADISFKAIREKQISELPLKIKIDSGEFRGLLVIDEKNLFAYSYYQGNFICNIDSEKCIPFTQIKDITSAVILVNNLLVAVVPTYQNNQIQVWDLKTKTYIKTLADYAGTYIVKIDGSHFAYSSKGNIYVWNINSEKPMRVFSPPATYMVALPNGKLLVNGRKVDHRDIIRSRNNIYTHSTAVWNIHTGICELNSTISARETDALQQIQNQILAGKLPARIYPLYVLSNGHIVFRLDREDTDQSWRESFACIQIWDFNDKPFLRKKLYIPDYGHLHFCELPNNYLISIHQGCMLLWDLQEYRCIQILEPASRPIMLADQRLASVFRDGPSCEDPYFVQIQKLTMMNAKSQSEIQIELQNKLTAACLNNNLILVESLIATGANPAEPDARGLTPLMAAVAGLAPSIVEFLEKNIAEEAANKVWKSFSEIRKYTQHSILSVLSQISPEKLTKNHKEQKTILERYINHKCETLLSSTYNLKK